MSTVVAVVLLLAVSRTRSSGVPTSGLASGT
jgi:hypothetical protein